MIAADSNVRVCPICSHRQQRSDPAGHVCAQVLREALRQARTQLNDAQASIESLQRDLATSERYGQAAHARGFAVALRIAMALFGRLPGAHWLLAPQMHQLAQLEQRARASVSD